MVSQKRKSERNKHHLFFFFKSNVSLLVTNTSKCDLKSSKHLHGDLNVSVVWLYLPSVQKIPESYPLVQLGTSHELMISVVSYDQLHLVKEKDKRYLLNIMHDIDIITCKN